MPPDRVIPAAVVREDETECGEIGRCREVEAAEACVALELALVDDRRVPVPILKVEVLRLLLCPDPEVETLEAGEVRRRLLRLRRLRL